MTNHEFYVDRTIAEAQGECKKQGFKSLDEFLAAEHKWTPEYAVGDIVAFKFGDAAMIVKIDHERDGYACVGFTYTASTLLPVFVGEGKLEDKKLVVSAIHNLPEISVGEKIGRIECKEFLDAISEHL